MLKYALFIAIPIIWSTNAFLSYPAPATAYWLIWFYVACLLALFSLFLGALLRRRWKSALIFCAMAPVVLLPYLGLNVSFGWLYVEGFRFHASPIEEYLSRCKLIEFVERGTEQRLGVCERQRWPGEGVLTVVYDTTGELALPVSRRTPEWTKVMMRFSPGKFFTRSEGRAGHLFGNFYEISVPLEEADGGDDY
jgi:hypothetical protein